MKPFAERNRVIVGMLGVAVTAGVVVAALQYDKLPFLNSTTQHSAYFAEAGGLRTGAAVQVSGYRVGDVASIELDGPRVLVTFKVDKKVRLGDRSEAAIKTKTVLGAKFLSITSRGEGPLSGTIPVERTTPAYELPDALGDLATTVDDLNTNQVSDSLATLADTFQRTPPDLKVAVEGVARFSDTLDKRDAELRALLANANKATTVLAGRADQVVSLIKNTDALLAQLRTQSSALDQISTSISALATQLSGFIAENRTTLRPALDKLNGVLAIVDGRKERVQKALKLGTRYLMQIGEAQASGPFIKSYITNLLPGQFLQPFVDAAFSDLGLDPNVLPPSELTDPQTGQPGTPALPVPFPRTGQGGEPHLTLPDAITGNPGDQGCGPPGLPLPGPIGCYPYREPPPAPPPGGPPPGPPAVATAPRASRRRRTDPLAGRQTRARAGTVYRTIRTGVAVALALLLAGGVVMVARSLWNSVSKTHLVAYFDNSNGIFPGDEVRILGVPVGAIDSIEPQPQRAKITFWVDDKYDVPADAKAVILAPQLVTARAIQLTPVYTGGAVMADGAVIPEDRTAVPVEWDELRVQLEKLAEMLQPTQPGDVSTLGALINTGADNLRGQGPSIRDTVIKMAQAFSVLGDHSNDLFSSVKNLSTLVSALQSSSDLMAQLNRNLAAVSALLADDPHEVGRAVDDLNTAVGDVQSFVADNRETVGTTFDKLTSVSQALVDSIDDLKQFLHLAPGTLQGLSNIYQPAQAALSTAPVVNNLANPIEFLCGAVQAASRLGAEQSSKLCVQYLAPIVKNRQINFLPIGLNPFVGAQARPNEITYSEDWMRPDYVPPPPAAPADGPPLAAEAAPATMATDPAAGLPGLMVPPGPGS
jgi:phospholipid/cholesterol/gamma-HCH transport system substrate-binding protein